MLGDRTNERGGVRTTDEVHNGSETRTVLYVAKILFELTVNPTTEVLEEAVGGWPGDWEVIMPLHLSLTPPTGASISLSSPLSSLLSPLSSILFSLISRLSSLLPSLLPSPLLQVMPDMIGWLELGFTWGCMLFWTMLGNTAWSK